jgi:alpha-D-ribose 1-methylphosphonate 5-phosphate C-P lyase
VGLTSQTPPGAPATVADLVRAHGRRSTYAYLDERSKRAVRRALLKALAIPGHQVPFASREMPVARGWGSGGLQITLSLVGPGDVVKVIDQGDDASLNASAMRDLVRASAGCGSTTSTADATIVQSRHRIPEVPMRPDQLLVLQLPHPEPLRRVEPLEDRWSALHADGDYTAAWLDLFDDEVRRGGPLSGADHPVLVEGGRLMSPSPIPRYDVLRLDDRPHPVLLGAGRRARVTALPPHTRVVPLALEGRPLSPEEAGGRCHRCESGSAYRVEVEPGSGRWACTDVDACARRTS